MSQTVMAHIHSRDGELCEAVIHEKIGDNDYLAEFEGVKCHAIFNVFAGRYYVDDKYGIINDEKSKPLKQHDSR